MEEEGLQLDPSEAPGCPVGKQSKSREERRTCKA